MFAPGQDVKVHVAAHTHNERHGRGHWEGAVVHDGYYEHADPARSLPGTPSGWFYRLSDRRGVLHEQAYHQSLLAPCERRP